MRTFPKSLAAFRRIVNERGDHLRELKFEELKALSSVPDEHLRLDSRSATIATIVQPLKNGGIRVVVQGFMAARLVPGKHVAVDGFYKYPDGSVAPMEEKEFYDFG